MINIEELDTQKTYVGYQVGTGFVAGLIQKLSKKETKIPTKKIASHIFSLVYLDNDWYVFEAHLKWKGCKKILFSEWIKKEIPEQNFVAERVLDVGVLEYYANSLFNPGYSVAQITEDALKEITSKDFWNDSPGMVCSEYIANADKDFKISYDYELKFSRIKPVHWQNELVEG